MTNHGRFITTGTKQVCTFITTGIKQVCTVFWVIIRLRSYNSFAIFKSMYVVVHSKVPFCFQDLVEWFSVLAGWLDVWRWVTGDADIFKWESLDAADMDVPLPNKNSVMTGVKHWTDYCGRWWWHELGFTKQCSPCAYQWSSDSVGATKNTEYWSVKIFLHCTLR